MIDLCVTLVQLPLPIFGKSVEVRVSFNVALSI